MKMKCASRNGLRKSFKGNVDFEARWAMAAKAGYTMAFDELVTRNESRIYRLGLNITQNQEDAEYLLLSKRRNIFKNSDVTHTSPPGWCKSAY